MTHGDPVPQQVLSAMTPPALDAQAAQRFDRALGQRIVRQARRARAGKASLAMAVEIGRAHV